ncbi:MAG: DUF6737 family protein [Cyanobacteria bacterium P01_D01_bin.71]
MPSSASDSSVWDYKPWWCQPWSILLTGISIITGSWLLFHRYWLTGIVAVPILVWMSFFLVVYPRLMAATASVDPPDLPSSNNLPEI